MSSDTSWLDSFPKYPPVSVSTQGSRFQPTVDRVFSLADADMHPVDQVPAQWPYRAQWHLGMHSYRGRQVLVRDDGAWGATVVEGVPTLLFPGHGPPLRGRVPPEGTPDADLYAVLNARLGVNSDQPFVLPVPRARSMAHATLFLDTVFPSAQCPVEPGHVWAVSRIPNATSYLLVTSVVRKDTPLWPRVSPHGRVVAVGFAWDIVSYSLQHFVTTVLVGDGNLTGLPRGTGNTFATWTLSSTPPQE